MAQAREIPEAWRVLMDRRGISSIRQLAMRAGVSHVTANRLVYSDPFFTSEENIQKIADALGTEYDMIYRLAGRTANHAEKYAPPASSSRLTQAQRKVVDQVIEMMVSGQRLIAHPEEGHDLAADTSHGPAESQRELD